MSRSYTSVLAVDDDPILLQVLTAFFTKHGVASVLTASNGTAATKLLGEHQEVELIVSDLHMPDADGIEFIDHLREMGCQIPVIIVSSADKTTLMAAGVLAKAYQLNFLGSLPKPVDFKALRSLLRL